MNKQVYNKLKQIAKLGRVITYSELNSYCDLGLDFTNIKDRNKISKILGEIANYEVKHKRPMLSAIVVLKGSIPLKPAFGFFNYADELGIRNKNESDLQLYYRQLKLCWEKYK